MRILSEDEAARKQAAHGSQEPRAVADSPEGR